MAEQIKYNSDWFKKRALENIHPLVPHAWDFSDSLLLYASPTGVEEYESLQETDTPYFNLVTAPEGNYLKSIAKDLASQLPASFDYIDLGPGTEHKEQFFFDELKIQGKKFTYVPVDISSHYLKLAEAHASNQGINVRSIQSSFEEAAGILGAVSEPRFVHIGLTFINYEPQVILGMLKNIAGQDGYIFINAQIRDRIDTVALQKIYAIDAATLADDKIKLLGLDPSIDVTPRIADDQVKVWCSVINTSPELKQIGIEAGDKLLVFQSLRYGLEQLDMELRKFGSAYQLFDIGQSFVGALIKT